jgi:CHRD domain/PEP-CTERM motif
MRGYSFAKFLSFRWAILPLIGVCLLGASASADILTFEANLDPFQEVPPHNVPGFGFAELTLDTVTGFVTLTNSSYQDLIGNSTAVTLNDAPVGSNGVTILSLTLDSPGTTTGTFSGSGTITAGQVTDMIATNTYINIRSNVFPSGEIRGQLFLVPEPSSVMLACSGIIGLIVIGRRRK